MAKEQAQLPDIEDEEEIPLEDDAPAQGEAKKDRKPADRFTVAKRILASLNQQKLVDRVSIINALQPDFDSWKHELANKLMPY